MDQYRLILNQDIEDKNMSWRIRGLTIMLFLFFIGVTSVHAQTPEQRIAQAKLTSEEPLDNLPDAHIRLSGALERLEEKYNISFMYKTGLLLYVTSLHTEVSVSPEELGYDNLTLTLKKLLEPYNLTYTRLNNRTFAISFDFTKYATGRKQKVQEQIQGIVTDAQTGETLPGVNVMIKGTTTGTATDGQGNFKLAVESLQDTLIASFIGYQTREVPIDGRTQVDIQLTPEAIMGEEMVVVGYGTQRKENLTGSVSSVNFEDESISSRSVTNVSSALSGMSSGVTIQQGDGTPSSDGATIRIRGIGSLNSSQTPLVIIDGQPGDINSVNPNDVANISILKDAASAAIYGSRASNGVILITTKKGRNTKGDISFGYTGNAGFTEPTKLFNLVDNTANHMSLINQIQENSDLNPSFSQSRIDEWREKNKTNPTLYPNTNWWDAVIKQNYLQKHALSARGGSEKVNFYSSFGFLDNNGIIQNTAYSRYNFRINLDYKVNSWLELGTNLSAMLDESDPASADNIFRFFEATTPGMLPIHPDGRYGAAMTGGGEQQANNILKSIETPVGENNTQKYTGKLFGTINLAEGLEITGSYFLDMYNYDSWGSSRQESTWNFQNETIVKSAEGARLGIGNSYTKRKREIFDINATYVKEVDKHNFRILAGFNQEYFIDEGFNASKRDLLSLDLPVLDAAPNDPQAGGTTFDYAIRSYFGRLNYDFDDKYLFEANVRVDGSSRFSPDNRWGIFPSFSVGWVLSDESFWNSLEKISNYFKIRASWGQLGNNGIGNYAWQNIYNAANYSFNDQIVQGLAPSAIANNDITWETTNQLNVGVDFDLFNNLSFTLDYYDKFTDGVLANPPIPFVNGGLTPPTTNSAEVRNSGVEVAIGYNRQFGDLSLSVSLNGSYNKNRIEKYKSGVLEPHGAGVWTEGKPIGIYWVREVDHIVQNQSEIDNLISEGWEFEPSTPGPGDFLYKDQDGNKVINDEDRVLKGHPIPLYNYGGSINIGYKGFDLYALFNGIAEWDKYLSSQFFSTQPRVDGYLYPQRYLNSWTEENKSTAVPKLYTNNPKNDQQSDYFLYSADYLRLKTLQLGYTIPPKVVSSFNMKKLRLYINLENYFTFTSYPGMDPEANGSEYNGDITYPLMKTFSFGVNIDF